jgi:hypothetical protein
MTAGLWSTEHHERISMRQPAKSLPLLAGILVVACLAAGCGSIASSVISNLPTPTRTTTTSHPATTATTAAPATAAPATTAGARPTAGTVTSSPKVTVAKPAASPAASATSSTQSGTSLLWLWILLGVAALAGLIAWIVHSRRRRSARTADWRSRLVDAYAKGSALGDAMSVAEAAGGPAAGDAGARWADTQRRADDLTQTLYALREAVPDPDDQARIADVLASLQAVRSAMDAERVPGGANPEQAEVVRSRLFAFELSVRALRGAKQEFT